MRHSWTHLYAFVRIKALRCVFLCVCVCDIQRYWYATQHACSAMHMLEITSDTHMCNTPDWVFFVENPQSACFYPLQISLLSPECPVCMLAYEWDTCKLQPVALRCGHSFCRGCLSSVVSKLCPTCRRAFRHDAMTMAPNYALRELMAPVSELLEVRGF